MLYSQAKNIKTKNEDDENWLPRITFLVVSTVFQGKITGTITDGQGSCLVQMLIKGTKTGSADFDGKFSINTTF
jgi:hypothetical protein